MPKTETLQDFYTAKFEKLPEGFTSGIGHFNVFRLEDCMLQDGNAVAYSRRDFYKILLVRGNNRYHYADKSLEVSGTTLIFFNPQVPYTWETLSGDITGMFCIFTESFFTETTKISLKELPMFAHGGKPTYILTPEQDADVSSIFNKMLDEINSDYIYKYDLLRNYITELTHYALKRQPSETLYQHPDANSRITAVFTELLERQFPIETSVQRFSMRSAKDFAMQLSVHVNHLNRAIKTTTGKTTTSIIAERITTEAKALLKHTDWNVSEIGYCLGFEEAAHFNNFFKKQTSFAPSFFRNV
jgi:AraC family transcriptional regulator, transcriptional activator of pobA